MWNTAWIKFCSVDGCNKEADTKGFCRTHYARYWRNGTTDKLNGDKWFDMDTQYDDQFAIDGAKIGDTLIILSGKNI